MPFCKDSRCCLNILDYSLLPLLLRFPLTPQSSPCKPYTQASHLLLIVKQFPTFQPLPHLDTSTKALVFIVPWIWTIAKQIKKINNQEMNIQDRSRKLLKAILFCHQKYKKADRLCMKFSSTPIQMCRVASTPIQNHQSLFL